MAELIYVDRYDRHCLDKLVGTTTEDRLREEGHTFTLSDGTPYLAETRGSLHSMLIEEVGAPKTEEERPF